MPCITTCVCTSIYLFSFALSPYCCSRLCQLSCLEIFFFFYFLAKNRLGLSSTSKKSKTKSSTCVYSIISFTSSLLKSFFWGNCITQELWAHMSSRDTQSAKEADFRLLLLLAGFKMKTKMMIMMIILVSLGEWVVICNWNSRIDCLGSDHNDYGTSLWGFLCESRS